MFIVEEIVTFVSLYLDILPLLKTGSYIPAFNHVFICLFVCSNTSTRRCGICSSRSVWKQVQWSTQPPKTTEIMATGQHLLSHFSTSDQRLQQCLKIILLCSYSSRLLCYTSAWLVITGLFILVTFKAICTAAVFNFFLHLCCCFPIKALLSGSDKCTCQHCSQPAGGAACGRTVGEPFGTVCSTGPWRKESQREGLWQGPRTKGTWFLT